MYLITPLIIISLLSNNIIPLQNCLTYHSADNKCQIADYIQCYSLDSNRNLSLVSGCQNYCLHNTAALDCLLCEFGRRYMGRVCATITANNSGCFDHINSYWTTQEGCGICFKTTVYHYYCRHCGSLSDKSYTTSSNSCNTITSTPNCYLIEGNADCQICNDHYMMNQDQKTCSQVDTSISSNCLSYDKFQCSICRDTYQYNRNYYAVLFDQPNLSSANYDFLQHFIHTSYRIKNYPVSQCEPKTTISDCIIYLTGIKCKICDSVKGLIPSADMLNCIDPYQSFIEFCKLYNIEQNGCKQCQENYYLKNGKCARVDKVSNCSKYELNTCIECISTYKLIDGSCTLRNAIADCIKYHVSQDYCLECNSTFSLTVDQMACVSTLTSCKTHQKNTSGQTVCTQCIDEYYLSIFGQCVQGTVTNCQIYSMNNVCSQCKNHYYLQNGTCTYDLINNCDIHHYNNFNACTQCSQNYVLLQQYQTCQQIQTISNCQEYLYADKCKKCQDYYYLNDTKTQCNSITGNPNCMQYNPQDGCIQCETSYSIVNKYCVLNNEYFQTCQESDQFGLQFNNYKCKTCKLDHVPVDLTDYYSCHSYKFMYQRGLTNPDVNCLKYSYDSNSLSFACQLCQNNYYIRNGQCVSSCQSGELIFKYTIQKIQKLQTFDYNYIKYTGQNICGSIVDQVADCIRVAPDIYFQQTDYRKVTYSCIECANGTLKIPKIKTAVAEYTPNVNTTDGRLQKSPLRIFPGLTCKSMTNVKIEGILNNGYIDGCEYYVLLGFNNITGEYSYGCLKCEFGKNGIIKRHQSSNRGYIEECKDFELPENELTSIDGTCNTANFMSGFTHNQRDINWNQIPLESYLSCHSCVSPTLPYYLFLFINFEDISKFSIGTSFSYKKNNMKNHSMLLDYQMPNDPTPGRPLRCLQFNLDKMFNFKDPISDNIKNQIFFEDYLLKCQLFIVNTLKYKYILNTYDPQPEILKEIFYCGACRPGFKAVRFTPLDTGSIEISKQQYFYPYKIFDCIAIENCISASSKWVNNCEFCEQGYTWYWNSDTQTIEYDKCVLNNVENCMAIDNNGYCRICKKGYEFFDTKCILFKINKCLDNETIFVRDFPVNSSYIDFARNYFYIRDKSKGCNRCENNTQLSDDQRYVSFINIPTTLNRDQRVHCITNCSAQCTQNPTLWERHTFIENCEYYKYITYPESNQYGEEKTKIKCQKCNLGFALTTIYECMDATGFDNCLQIDQGNIPNTCILCEENYLFINGKCELKNITNCKIYNNNISSDSQICQQCEDYYYVDNNTNTCVSGTIPNCKVYQNETMCYTCDENYQNYIINNNKTECIQLHVEFNCLQLSNDDFLSSIYKCQKCIDNYMPSLSTNINSSQTKCFEHPVVDQCLSYNIQDNIKNSTFKCLQCTTDYYLDDINNICTLRTADYTYCDIRIINEDKCQQCLEGYNLVLDQRSCQQNQAQISGCNMYYKERVCLECKNNYYLKNNACIYVQDSEQIINCVVYEEIATQTYDNTTNPPTLISTTYEIKCKRCAPLYYLTTDTGQCKISSVSDCEVLVDKTNCKYCMNTFQLYIKPNADPTLQGTFECKLLEAQTNRPVNCEKSDYLHPSTCDICQDNLYAKDGICTLVPDDRKITNCLKYKLDTNNVIMCYLCTDGYNLYKSNDKFICEQISVLTEQPNDVHSTCRQLIRYDLAQCNSCQRGQHFDWDNNFETCINNIDTKCSVIRERDPSACNSCSDQKQHDGTYCV